MHSFAKFRSDPAQTGNRAEDDVDAHAADQYDGGPGQGQRPLKMQMDQEFNGNAENTGTSEKEHGSKNQRTLRF